MHDRSKPPIFFTDRDKPGGVAAGTRVDAS